METLINRIPQWLLVVTVLTLIVLSTCLVGFIGYAVYVGRSITIVPPGIGPKPPPDDPPSQTNIIVPLYSGTAGGVFYELGERLVKAIQKRPESPYRVESVPSEGSGDNCKKIKVHSDNNNESVLGLAFITDLHKDFCSHSVSLVSPLYSGVWFLAIRKDKFTAKFKDKLPLIENNDDDAICNILKNMGSIYIGSKQSGTQIIAKHILKKCNDSEELDKVKMIEDLGYGQVSDRLTEELPCHIDAAFFMLPPTSPIISDLRAKPDKICFVSINQNYRNAWIERTPSLGGIYPHDIEDSSNKQKITICGGGTGYESAFSWAFLVAPINAPDALIRTVIKALHDEKADWGRIPMLGKKKATEILQAIDYHPIGTSIPIHPVSKDEYEIH